MVLAFKRREDCFKLLGKIKFDIFYSHQIKKKSRIAARYFLHSVYISSDEL